MSRRAAKKSQSRKRVIDDETGQPADVPLSVPDASETRAKLIARNIKEINMRENRARQFVAEHKAKISERMCKLDLWTDFRVQICVCPDFFVHEIIQELHKEFPTYRFSINIGPRDLEDFARDYDERILEARA